jgi:hypothetical protein
MIRASFLAAALLASLPAVALDIPAKLAPPKGAKLVGTYKASGAQIYVCTVMGSMIQPILKAPDARLTKNGKMVAKHYAGPTWEAKDGSKVTGTMAETVPAPKDGAVAWLLLNAQSTGRGIFRGVKFVQRLATTGGAVTAAACKTGGMELRVPYIATYRFFR